MRIQHNVMAMNAYRNYTNNVNAMKQNLEKLSSGYKINRAGDDAAGLAISEKMRAQITGLETAQKNAKDGISLVQTAEGALTEVHDMLNRMMELATQSANGTYDNETDRDQLQKELDQLRTEIDRISKASNFNGIQLLDGSMDAEQTGIGATEGEAGTFAAFDIAAVAADSVDPVLGTNTIKHTGGGEATTTQFGIDLHEVSFENKAGQTFELTIGTEVFTLEGDDSGELNAAGIAAAFASGDFKNAAGDAVDADAVTIGAGTFAAEATATGLKFTQAEGETPVNGDMAVKVEGTVADEPTAPPTSAAVAVTTAGADAAKAVYTYNFNGVTGLSAGNYDVEIAGQKVTVTLADGADAEDLAAAVAAALDAPKDGIADDSVYGIDNPGGAATTITFTASANGAIADENAITGDIKITPSASGVKGDYNVQTTVTATGAEAGERRIASTQVTMDADTFADGNVIKIGDQEFTVSSTDKTADIYTGDLKLDTDDGLKAAIDRLSVAAEDNTVWSVGQGATAGSVTFVEKVSDANVSYMETENPEFDLTTEDGIKASLGIITGRTEGEAGTNGKSLTLQIGDSAKDYNQISVNIKACDSKAIGVGEISIATQEDAAKAIDAIKKAINYVSDVRGTLGATQNRLDHTINNLSVMTENIQDAESTIRDTDVAEEMMAYTKNNILIQSAQAMLAQANQVPQGVLQLLQ